MFFEQGDSLEQRKYRKLIYDFYKTNESVKNNKEHFTSLLVENKETEEAAAAILAFYDLWGLLAYKKFLPFWTFDGASGKTTKRMYKYLLPYIEYRQQQELENEPEFGVLYAKYFTWLINKKAENDVKRKPCHCIKKEGANHEACA